MGKLLILVLLLVSCGNITPSADGTGGRGAGGKAAAAAGNDAGGAAAAVDGAGGAGGELGTGGAVGQGGAGGASCLDANSPGFAFNISEACPRDAGAACFARCQLNGAPYAGCVVGSKVADRCFASCSDCP